MRIAVSGASGFLGKHLVAALLREGHDVLPLVREVDARAPVGATTLEDALASGRIDGDVFVHAAAVRHRHGTDARTYRASNVLLVERLLTALAGRVRRFVLVSSVGVYGFPTKLPISESHPFAPRTLYSATKVEAEKLVARLAPTSGLEYVVARPTITYGPGDRNGMLDKLVRMIAARRYLLVGDGSNTLHHTHVDDMIAGLALAATHPAAANDHFLFAGPETTTLRRLSELVAEQLQVRLPPLSVPLSMARAVATLFDVATYRRLAFVDAEPPINHEKLDVMTVPIAFDSGKAQRILGYAPRVRYAEGIASTLAAMAHESRP